ncbi:MAG: GFA family protein [Burkholderiales bacterium]|nr:GFA family protein [Burkholderiales bacterium]
MKVSGRCHCGNISYEAEVDPSKVSVCHCSDCQMLSGSAYRASVQAPRETFTLRGGPPKIYIKTADSGNQRAHAFCPQCGTPVYSAALSDPAAYSLRVGCLDQRQQLPPSRQIWCQSALGWSSNLERIEQVSRQ